MQNSEFRKIVDFMNPCGKKCNNEKNPSVKEKKGFNCPELNPNR